MIMLLEKNGKIDSNKDKFIKPNLHSLIGGDSINQENSKMSINFIQLDEIIGNKRIYLMETVEGIH
jgi:hypothetical protein